MAITKSLLTKIAKWNDLQAQLAAVKSQEASLRSEVFAALFDNNKYELKEGVNKLDLPDGWSIQATHKLNYSLDEAALPSVLEQLGSAGADLVKYKPSLTLPAYRKLDDKQAAILSQALTVKPGTPSMKLIAPKG